MGPTFLRPGGVGHLVQSLAGDLVQRPHPLDVQRQAHQIPLAAHLRQAAQGVSSESEHFLDPPVRRLREPLALRVPGLAREARQLLTHAVRGREPGRVDRHPGLALTPQRDVRVDAAVLQLQQIRLVAIARIGQYHRRFDPKRFVDPVEQPHQLTLIASLWAHLSRDDDLVLPIDRHLRVVALLESLAAGLHDLALGIGEIALRLRLGLAVGALVGPPAPGIAVLPRLAPVLIIARALRRLQTRFGGLDRRQALLPALQLLWQFVAAEILAPMLIFFGVHRPRLPQQRLDLRLQANLLLAHPLIAHRLALARVRSYLRPVDRQLAEPRQSHLARYPHHLHKQLAELPQMSASELAHRAMLREVARREHPKRHILLQLPRHRARGERARRVGIDQHLDHHRRLVRGVAPTVPLVRRMERRQVQCINHVADVVSEVTRGNPLLQVRRQKQGLVRLVATIRGRHQAVPKRNWRIGSYCPLPPIHPQSIRYQLRRADFSAAQAPSEARHSSAAVRTCAISANDLRMRSRRMVQDASMMVQNPSSASRTRW